MSAQRVILIDESRLLGEMLRTVIHKNDQLVMVQKVDSFEELSFAIDEFGADWIVVALPLGNNVPAWVDSFIQDHPLIRFMIIFAESGKIKMKWLETHEEEVEDASLTDLLHILESNPPQMATAAR